jgi:hypothetical protein
LKAVVFHVIDTTLFRPLPFRGMRIVSSASIYQHSDEGVRSSASFPAYRDTHPRHPVVGAVTPYHWRCLVLAESGRAICSEPDVRA